MTSTTSKLVKFKNDKTKVSFAAQDVYTSHHNAQLTLFTSPFCRCAVRVTQMQPPGCLTSHWGWAWCGYFVIYTCTAELQRFHDTDPGGLSEIECLTSRDRWLWNPKSLWKVSKLWWRKSKIIKKQVRCGIFSCWWTTLVIKPTFNGVIGRTINQDSKTCKCLITASPSRCSDYA